MLHLSPNIVASLKHCCLKPPTSCSYMFNPCRSLKKDLELMPNKLVQGKDLGHEKWYDIPESVTPNPVHPLDKGADFSFADGRSCEFSDVDQLEQRRYEVKLTQQIVQFLGEIEQAKQMHQHKIESMDKMRLDYEKDKPKAKGNLKVDDLIL